MVRLALWTKTLEKGYDVQVIEFVAVICCPNAVIPMPIIGVTFQ